MTQSNLYTDFLIAFGGALNDPINLRVIVETNENTVLTWRNPKTGEEEYDNLYFMIDLYQHNVWSVSGSDGHRFCLATPKNIARWAERMINKNRVTKIYSEGY